MWLLYYWMCSSIGIIGCGWSSVWTTKIFPHQPTVGPNCANLKGHNDNNDTIIQLHTNITLRQHWLLQQTINFCSFYQTCHPSIPRRKRKKSPLNTFWQFPCKELSPPTADWLGALCPHFVTRRSRRDRTWVDKAPCLSISIVIWILSSDTVCQLNQFNTNSEAAMLSIPELSEECIYKIIQELWLFTIWSCAKKTTPENIKPEKQWNITRALACKLFEDGSAQDHTVSFYQASP